MIHNISAVIITKDAQKHLQECLESLRDFEEVILYDNGSKDKTLKIAKSFKNVKIVQGDFLGFGKTKNIAASYARNDWIFSIDSDEIATKELIQEIKSIELDSSYVYALKRKNFFLKKEIRYSGWNPDWIKRVYNKKIYQFSDIEVHESIKTKRVKRLQSSIIHYAVDEVSDFLIKSAKYSKMDRGNRKKLSPSIAFFRALFAFFKTYIFKKGFLDGYEGLIIAVGNFNGVFFKYCYQYYKRNQN